ncbi:glycosyltransferase [Vibrio parahaemolyticus]|nr:glycosyltransferase [Vibrio parahaemolyticus]
MKKVLFVSHTARLNRPYFDPSVRYRCFNLADELNERGYYCKVTTSFEFIKNDISNFDIYVFHRPPFDPEFIDKVKWLQNNGKIVIADYDDLVFDIENALSSSLYKSGRASQRDVLNIFSRNSAALNYFKYFTVSTHPLGARIYEISKEEVDVCVVHNALTEKYKSICDQLRLNEAVEKVKGRVGYFSGTKSHDKDLALVADAIAESCAGKELLFVGPIDVPEVIQKSCKVTQIPLVGYHEMVKLIATCEVVIAPLESSIFNSCKSGLKYFESAYAGCSVVATPIPDIDRFTSQGLFKATSLDEWKLALKQATESFESIPESERINSAKEQANIKLEVEKWLEFVNKISAEVS